MGTPIFFVEMMPAYLFTNPNRKTKDKNNTTNLNAIHTDGQGRYVTLCVIGGKLYWTWNIKIGGTDEKPLEKLLGLTLKKRGRNKHWDLEHGRGGRLTILCRHYH